MTVIVDWPDYFPLGGVDKQIELGNIGLAKQQGMPIEDTVRWLARIVGVPSEELGEFLKRPTLMFNGYGEQVAHLYDGMDLIANY